MNVAVDKLHRKANPKSRALLRCAKYVGLIDIVCLYKSHVRSQVEWCNAATYHAAKSILSKLDGIQTSFLGHLRISVRSAFLDFQLAPLELPGYRHARGPLENRTR